MNTVLLIVYIFVSILFIVLAVPLIQGRIPPNNWYGVRLPQTRNNPDVWYKVNAYFARRWLVLGVVLALAAIILAFLPGVNVGVYVAVCNIILIGGLILIIVLSLSYMQSLVR